MVIGNDPRPPTQGQVGESWHRPAAAADQSTLTGDRRRPPTEGQIGEPWHPRVNVPMPPAQSTGQHGRLAAWLVVLVAALAISAGLVVKRAGRRPRPRLTA